MSYDSECLKLADHFLQDSPPEISRKRNDLAQTIQGAVEDWFFAEESPSETTEQRETK